MYKHRRWKPQEDVLLIELFDKKSNKELGVLFNRTRDKITRRAKKLGLNKSIETISRNLSEGLKGRIDNRGEKNPRWKEGRIQKGGYIYIWTSDKGYIAEHRLVMENQLERTLLKNELVHHINHNKSDNRVENLRLETRQSHLKHNHRNSLLKNLSKTPTHKNVETSKI